MESIGLAGLFRRENPHERRIRTIGAMMEHSGLVKPVLGYMLGREMAAAERMDDEIYRQIDTYLAKKAEIEALKDKREAMKFQYETLKTALEAADKIWNSTTHLPERERGQAVIEFVNPLLSQVGLPPLKGYSQDAHGQRSFETVIGRDEKGNLITKQGYISNGQLFIQDSIDETGRPVFKPATEGMMRLKDFIELQSLTKKEPPKMRVVQRGAFEITEEFDPDTGTWKEIGRGPKWNPRESVAQPSPMIIEHPDTKHRVVIDKKNISELQKYLDQGYVPYSTEDMNLLKEYLNLIMKPRIEELKKKQKGALQGTSTITPQETGKPPIAGAKLAPDGKWYIQKNGKWYRVD